MEPNAEWIVPNPGEPGTLSIVDDLIMSDTVGFEGMAHVADGGDPIAIYGFIQWHSMEDWQIEMERKHRPLEVDKDRQRGIDVSVCTSSVEPERDTNFALVTGIDYGNARDDFCTAFDFGFMKKLLERDREAEDELVSLVEANCRNAGNPKIARYEIRHSDEIRSLIVRA